MTPEELAKKLFVSESNGYGDKYIEHLLGFFQLSVRT
jgi:hypothetical protein